MRYRLLACNLILCIKRQTWYHTVHDPQHHASDRHPPGTDGRGESAVWGVHHEVFLKGRGGSTHKHAEAGAYILGCPTKSLHVSHVSSPICSTGHRYLQSRPAAAAQQSWGSWGLSKRTKTARDCEECRKQQIKLLVVATLYILIFTLEAAPSVLEETHMHDVKKMPSLLKT